MKLKRFFSFDFPHFYLIFRGKKPLLKEKFQLFEKLMDQFNKIKTFHMKKGVFDNFIDDFELEEDFSEKNPQILLKEYRILQELDCETEENEVFLLKLPEIIEEIVYEKPVFF